MIPGIYKKQVAEAQRIRNTILGEKKYTDEELSDADKILTKIFSNSDNDKFIVDPIIDHPYLRYGLTVSYGWYSPDAQFNDPEMIIPRSSIARIILFRECFLLSQHTNDPWRILNQICDIQSIKDYAHSGCKSMDLDTNQYFLHSTHSIKKLDKDGYDKLNKEGKAAILCKSSNQSEII